MKDARKRLMSHLLMVVAPLLALLIISLAWFINSRTVGMSEMSFASQDVTGVSVYPYATLTDLPYEAGTLSHTITWGEKLSYEGSAINIENMVPGQCEYYLLVSNGNFTPELTDIQITASDSTTTPLLKQCLAFYLLPTEVNLANSPTGQTESKATLTLTRKTDNMLSAALLKNWTAGNVTLPKPVVADYDKNAYILAVFCDGVYGQNARPVDPVDEKVTHVSTLSGDVSFSLNFITAGAS